MTNICLELKKIPPMPLKPEFAAACKEVNRRFGILQQQVLCFGGICLIYNKFLDCFFFFFTFSLLFCEVHFLTNRVK